MTGDEKTVLEYQSVVIGIDGKIRKIGKKRNW